MIDIYLPPAAVIFARRPDVTKALKNPRVRPYSSSRTPSWLRAWRNSELATILVGTPARRHVEGGRWLKLRVGFDGTSRPIVVMGEHNSLHLRVRVLLQPWLLLELQKTHRN